MLVTKAALCSYSYCISHRVIQCMTNNGQARHIMQAHEIMLE